MTSLAELDMMLARQLPGDHIHPNDEAAQSYYRTYTVRSIVEVESFTTTRILTLIERHVNNFNDRIVEAMFKNIKGGIERNWESIVKSAKEYLDINLKQAESYKDLMAYVDVRNAAMHGNGYLTRLQQSDQRVYQRLQSIGVSLDHHKLILSKDDVRKCALVARSFVMSVDTSTWSPGDHID